MKHPLILRLLASLVLLGLSVLFSPAFAAVAANDLILTQRNAANDNNTARYVPAVANGILTFTSSIPATITTSAGLRGAISDETGTGALVFAGGDIGAATGTSLALSGAVTLGADSTITTASGPTWKIKTSGSTDANGAIQFRGSDDVVDWEVATNRIIGTGFEINRAAANILYMGTTGAITLGSASSITAAASTDLTLAGGSGGANVLLAPSAGDVGVGTSTPAKSGASRTAITLNDAALSIFEFAIGDTLSGYVYTNSSDMTLNAQSTRHIKFETNNAERARIAGSTGNLLIGGTTDITGTASLGVYGSIQIPRQASDFAPGSTIAAIYTKTNSGGGTEDALILRADGFRFEKHDGTLLASIRRSGDVAISSTTASTSTTSGALQVAGGVGVAGSIYVGGDLTVSGTGASTIAGTLGIGGTSAIAGVRTATATLDFPSTLTAAVSDLTITVTGAAAGDTVSIGVPNGSVTATGTYFAWVSATNTVTVRFSHNSAGSEDPASGTFRATVTSF